jgi:hypothetical protein
MQADLLPMLGLRGLGFAIIMIDARIMVVTAHAVKERNRSIALDKAFKI